MKSRILIGFCRSILYANAECIQVPLLRHSGLKRCLTNVISHSFNGEAHIRESLKSESTYRGFSTST